MNCHNLSSECYLEKSLPSFYFSQLNYKIKFFSFYIINEKIRKVFTFRIFFCSNNALLSISQVALIDQSTRFLLVIFIRKGAHNVVSKETIIQIELSCESIN